MHDFNTQIVTIQARFRLTVSDLRCYTVCALFRSGQTFPNQSTDYKDFESA